MLLFYRSGGDGSLEIDGASFIEGQAKGILKELNVKGNIYIGKLISHGSNIIC